MSIRYANAPAWLANMVMPLPDKVEAAIRRGFILYVFFVGHLTRHALWFTAMPLPKYENTEVAALEEQFAAIVKQAEELSAHSELRLKELEEELKAVQSEKVRCSQPGLPPTRSVANGGRRREAGPSL